MIQQILEMTNERTTLRELVATLKEKMPIQSEEIDMLIEMVGDRSCRNMLTEEEIRSLNLSDETHAMIELVRELCSSELGNQRGGKGEECVIFLVLIAIILAISIAAAFNPSSRS